MGVHSQDQQEAGSRRRAPQEGNFSFVQHDVLVVFLLGIGGLLLLGFAIFCFGC